jgi:hypothetical protein
MGLPYTIRRRHNIDRETARDAYAVFLPEPVSQYTEHASANLSENTATRRVEVQTFRPEVYGAGLAWQPVIALTVHTSRAFAAVELTPDAARGIAAMLMRAADDHDELAESIYRAAIAE